MWNYNFVIPSVMVLLIIIIYYFLRPRLPIRMNQTFPGLLLVDILTIGCDYLQGFYFSRPIPFDEFLAKYASAS